MIGLALPTHVLQICLGAPSWAICLLMLVARKSEFPDVPKADRLSTALGIHGFTGKTAAGRVVTWKIHRTPLGAVPVRRDRGSWPACSGWGPVGPTCPC